MPRRHLRLKEHQPMKEGAWTPKKEYLERTDGSLQGSTFEYQTLPGGFLDTGIELKPTLPNVFIIGSSFVESSFAKPEQRFPSQVGASIDSHNIVNAGYSGTTTLQAVLLIMGKLPIYAKKNDTVLLFIPKSDANAFTLHGGYWNNSRAYSPVVPTDFETSWQSSGDDLESLIRAVATFLDGIGLNLLIATSPHRNGDFSSDGWLRLAYRRDRDKYEKIVELRSSLDQRTRAVTAGLDVPLLDLSEKFTDRDELFYDEMHLNELGQAEIAEYISNFLKEYL